MTQFSVNSHKIDRKHNTAINKNEQDEKENKDQLLPYAAIVKHCIYENDAHRLQRCFEDLPDLYKDRINEILNLRDTAGKSPLDLTASLGRTELTNLLIQGGADINSLTSKGYTCLHHAAAWGQLEVLKILVDNGGILQQKNIHGETPRDVALRYNQLGCVDYLEIAEEKEKLQSEISHALGKIQEMDKSTAGRISRDEKNLVVNTCKGKQEWLNNMSSASVQDIRTQHLELIDIVQPVLAKLSEPPPERHDKREVKDK